MAVRWPACGGGSVAGMGTALASGGVAELARTLGSGYQGPPELTVTRVFTQWTLDPWMLALVLVLGGGYLAGARRQPGWPVGRRIWFLCLGLGFLVIATMSWVGVYQPVLFYVRAVQTVLLETNSPYLMKGWGLCRQPPFPLVYRARLGRRFYVTGGAEAFAQQLEAYFRTELGPS